ncbi:MAG TPA: hypothetical protein VF493_15885, partial [Terriglobales bacterium]
DPPHDLATAWTLAPWPATGRAPEHLTDWERFDEILAAFARPSDGDLILVHPIGTSPGLPWRSDPVVVVFMFVPESKYVAMMEALRFAFAISDATYEFELEIPDALEPQFDASRRPPKFEEWRLNRRPLLANGNVELHMGRTEEVLSKVSSIKRLLLALLILASLSLLFWWLR